MPDQNEADSTTVDMCDREPIPKCSTLLRSIERVAAILADIRVHMTGCGGDMAGRTGKLA